MLALPLLPLSNHGRVRLIQRLARHANVCRVTHLKCQTKSVVDSNIGAKYESTKSPITHLKSCWRLDNFAALRVATKIKYVEIQVLCHSNAKFQAAHWINQRVVRNQNWRKIKWGYGGYLNPYFSAWTRLAWINWAVHTDYCNGYHDSKYVPPNVATQLNRQFAEFVAVDCECAANLAHWLQNEWRHERVYAGDA